MLDRIILDEATLDVGFMFGPVNAQIVCRLLIRWSYSTQQIIGILSSKILTFGPRQNPLCHNLDSNIAHIRLEGALHKFNIKLFFKCNTPSARSRGCAAAVCLESLASPPGTPSHPIPQSPSEPQSPRSLLPPRLLFAAAPRPGVCPWQSHHPAQES